VRLGISSAISPPDWSALTAYWRRTLAPGGPIHVTPTARRLAPLIVRPPIPMVPGMATDLLSLPGFALLPRRLRREFGIAWDSGRELLALAAGKAIKSWVRLAPLSVRSMPQARDALRRVAMLER
jgi:uncharacterized protein (DUF2236 family)